MKIGDKVRVLNLPKCLEGTVLEIRKPVTASTELPIYQQATTVAVCVCPDITVVVPLDCVQLVNTPGNAQEVVHMLLEHSKHTHITKGSMDRRAVEQATLQEVLRQLDLYEC